MPLRRALFGCAAANIIEFNRLSFYIIRIFRFVLLDQTDHEQCSDHQRNADGKHDEPFFDQSCQDIADKRNTCNRQRVGQLR